MRASQDQEGKGGVGSPYRKIEQYRYGPLEANCLWPSFPLVKSVRGSGVG